jgi:hypothetical protein
VGRTFQCVPLDAFKLASRPVAERDRELSETIQREVLLEDKVRTEPKRIAIYRALRLVLSPVLAATGNGAAAGGIGTLAAAAEAESRKLAPASIPDLMELDRIVLFLDDLDRCDPRDAITILANINVCAADANVNVIMACDPDVLASHVAATCGISHGAGRDVLSKYVHVPLCLPTGRTPGHREALGSIIAAWGCSNELTAAIISSIGYVPIREILGAVPQAALWLEAIPQDLAEQTGTGLAPPCLFLAIVGNAFPMALRVASQTLPDMMSFRTVFLEPQTNKLRFAQSLVDSLNQRSDLLKLGARVFGQTPEKHFQQLVAILAAHG